jgi:hypothetical protein
VPADDDKLQSKMTSPDSRVSSKDFQKVATAFAVERQVLLPELTRLIVDKEQIAAGLLLCFSMMVGQTIDQVTIDKIDRIYPSGRNQGLIDFKLGCRLSSKIQVILGICVLPDLDLKVINEACNRLLIYKDFGLDRLCVIGQSNLISDVQPLPTCLTKLLSADIGGYFVPLKPQAVLSILTILSIFQHKQQYEVTNELIFACIGQAGFLAKNAIVQNVLVTARS